MVHIIQDQMPIGLLPVLAEISASQGARSLLLTGSGDPFHALISIFKNVEFAYLSVVMAIERSPRSVVPMHQVSLFLATLTASIPSTARMVSISISIG